MRAACEYVGMNRPLLFRRMPSGREYEVKVSVREGGPAICGVDWLESGDSWPSASYLHRARLVSVTHGMKCDVTLARFSDASRS